MPKKTRSPRPAPRAPVLRRLSARQKRALIDKYRFIPAYVAVRFWRDPEVKRKIGREFFELLQLAWVGLLQAAEGYRIGHAGNGNGPARFQTYAMRACRNTILKELSRPRLQLADLDIEPGHEREEETGPDPRELSMLSRAMRHLEPRARLVVCRHFGLGGRRPLTLEEVGRLCGGYSKAWASRICKKALEQMRATMEVEHA